MSTTAYPLNLEDHAQWRLRIEGRRATSGFQHPDRRNGGIRLSIQDDPYTSEMIDFVGKCKKVLHFEHGTF
jgi:hypothetical protein